MKYIIVGLGNFGASLAQKLTALGNEVIGVDVNMNKVEALREKVTHTICMDATDEFAVSGLPLKDTDVVIVAIGENQGSNVMATALMKNLAVKKLISRAIDPLHEKVLQAIGVYEIVHPEEETAERWAKKLEYSEVVDSFELDPDYSIVEILMPSDYIGKTLDQVKIRERYNLLVLTTISSAEEKSLFGRSRKIARVQGVASPRTVMQAGDLMVVYGSNRDIEKFLRDTDRNSQ